MVNLLLADDHQIIRDGLKMILESTDTYKVIGEAANGDELVEKALLLKSEIILSDLKMPGTSILDSCKQLKKDLPDTKIIILTAFDESEDIYRAWDGGVDGYIMKDTPPEQILNTLNMVKIGYSLYQPKVDKKDPGQTSKGDDGVNFTEREAQIFQLIVENYSNIEIAEALFISEATVKTHVSSILRKTGQQNRSQAVLYGIKKGFVNV
ncbi:response regulator [Rossellomorea vietnamensis]|uniref:response regulator n=1 Tax=Rossellomorea vietnamensis TaxID=218284 RepID=UPI003CF4ECED